MDAFLLLIGGAVAVAVFAAAMAVQASLGATRVVVQDRILGGGTEQEQAGFQLNIPRLASLSERGQRTALELERAGLALTVSEYLFIRAGAGLGGAILALVLASSFSFGGTATIGSAVLGFLIGYWLPSHYVHDRKARRLRKVEDQLLEVLVSMAKSLKAGVGLTQALEYAGRETPEPLGPELLRVVRDLQLGADVEVAFEDLNARMASPDLEITSQAIVIQRRVGGNLSEILTNVSETIRERKSIRNELHAITAKQRFQGNASALIPVFVAVFFFLVNRETAELLFTTTTGNIALAVGIFFEVLGLWLVRRFAVIEV